MTNKFINGVVKTVKIAGVIVISAAIAEESYHGARMLCEDVEYTAKKIDSKINPIVMVKPAWYKKPQPFNTRTQKFVSDKKTNKKSK